MGRRKKTPVITTKEEEEIRRRAVEKGVNVYFSYLPPNGVPEQRALESAVRRSEAAASEELLPALLDSVADEPLPPERRSLLLLRMEERLPALILPEPELLSEIPPLRAAAASAFGTIAGMAFLPSLTWILLGNRAAGVFIGAPLGALFGTLAALLLPRSQKLLLLLAAILGLATVREVIRFLSGGAIFFKGWSLLREKSGSLKGLVLFPLLLATLLLLGARETRFDRKRHEESVRRAFASWTEGAARVALLAASPSAPLQKDEEEAIPLLASRILSLEGACCEDLTAGVSELAAEVRNLGYSDENPAVLFRWNEEAAGKYTSFGAVEPGDAVRVEREPLFRNGELLAKGLVRKVRRS